MTRFQAVLDKFEPATEGQKILHAETLRAYNLLIQSRRLRLDAVGTGLPAVMWAVIVIGAFIGLSASFFFRVEDARLHVIEVLLLAVFIGLVIFMILVPGPSLPRRPGNSGRSVSIGLRPTDETVIYDKSSAVNHKTRS